MTRKKTTSTPAKAESAPAKSDAKADAKPTEAPVAESAVVDAAPVSAVFSDELESVRKAHLKGA